MHWKAWASTAATRPEQTPPADEWTLVGWVDTDWERDLGKYLQGVLGLRAPGRSRKLDFYVSVDPAVGFDVGSGFWLAVAPPTGRSPVAVTTSRVQPAALAHRPQQPHPGLLVRPEPAGVRCTALPGLPLFERRD